MANEYDIIIAGGGLAGQIALIACAQAGFDTLCIDPAPPKIAQSTDADYRATALLGPSVEMLRQLGIWDELHQDAVAMREMRIVDTGGADHTIRYDARFLAQDIEAQEFGHSVLNWRFAAALSKRIAELPNATFHKNTKLTDFLAQSDRVLLRTDQAQLSAKLLIAADGRNSFVRNKAGIDVTTTRYGQVALNFVVSHERPHEGASIELHRTGGPFTFVPLPSAKGLHLSSVVWMDHAKEAERRRHLSATAFLAEAQLRSADILGALQLESPIGAWPMIAQRAKALSVERVALIAEAAHTIPPIGAQGLNMSLADIRALIDSLATNPCGEQAQLDHYAKARQGDIATRIAGVDLLNRAAMVNNQTLKDLRLAGLRSLHKATPIRTSLMRRGLGTN